ncbi:unnamed protein product, partial [Sphagnum tenellum]
MLCVLCVQNSWFVLNLMVILLCLLVGSLKHMKMGGCVTSKLPTCIIINPLCLHLSGPPKISHPPYLSN